MILLSTAIKLLHFYLIAALVIISARNTFFSKFAIKFRKNKFEFQIMPQKLH